MALQARYFFFSINISLNLFFSTCTAQKELLLNHHPEVMRFLSLNGLVGGGDHVDQKATKVY